MNVYNLIFACTLAAMALTEARDSNIKHLQAFVYYLIAVVAILLASHWMSQILTK